MGIIASPFYDEDLICGKNYEPINYTLARVETRTFVYLLFIQIMRDKFRVTPGPSIRKFMECYDDAMVRIAEVDRIAKDPKIYADRLSKIVNTENLSVSTIEEMKLKQLTELGKREESIRKLLDKLQKDLFNAAERGDDCEFNSLLKEATTEIKNRVDYLCELFPETD